MEASGELKGIGEDFDLVLPEGTLLIRLSTPLCFAALPRTVQTISDFSDPAPTAILLWVRYPLNNGEASVLDFAVNALATLGMRSIVISDRYASMSKIEDRNETKRFVKIVRTLNEGLRFLRAKE